MEKEGEGLRKTTKWIFFVENEVRSHEITFFMSGSSP